jgi:hypothetical protein
MNSSHQESVSAILSHLLGESDLEALVVDFPAGAGKVQVMNEVIQRLKSRGLRVRLVTPNTNLEKFAKQSMPALDDVEFRWRNPAECDQDVDFTFAESYTNQPLKILKNKSFTIRGSA